LVRTLGEGGILAGAGAIARVEVDPVLIAHAGLVGRGLEMLGVFCPIIEW
jgi:hypothetical protein